MSEVIRGPMNALAIAMVKNEADIIEAFVRHNLHFVDLLVIIDNHSTDGTREILQALRREGLPLLVVDDPVFGHFQSEKVTHVYRKVAPIYEPELVYLLDADEFLRAPDRAAAESVLGGLVPGSVALLPWQTHMPAPSVPPERLLRDPLGGMALRRRVEEPTYHKAVIRRRAADDARLVVEQGNHAVHLDGGDPMPVVLVDGLVLSHYPVRSSAQVSAKAVNGWLACVARRRASSTQGEAYQWKALYDQILAGNEIGEATLMQVGLDYAQRPRNGRDPARDLVPDATPARYGELRYLHMGRHQLLAKLVRSMEGYLGAAASTPHREAVAARDLAPLIDLVGLLGARSLGGIGEGRLWVADLLALHPNLHVSAAAGPPDVLLAPDLLHEECMALTSMPEVSASARIVYWTVGGIGATQMQRELEAWYRKGWEPHLQQTMGYRALASYAAHRRYCVVLQPADPMAAQRAALVRQLMCALADRPAPWIDPPPQCVRYPLQTLALAA